MVRTMRGEEGSELGRMLAIMPPLGMKLSSSIAHSERMRFIHTGYHFSLEG